jgi:hypothetical protein
MEESLCRARCAIQLLLLELLVVRLSLRRVNGRGMRMRHTICTSYLNAMKKVKRRFTFNARHPPATIHARIPQIISNILVLPGSYICKKDTPTFCQRSARTDGTAVQLVELRLDIRWLPTLDWTTRVIVKNKCSSS